MTEKVSILQQEDLPMPLIYHGDAETLAEWYTDQLAWSLGQGHRALTVSCFDTAPMGFDIGKAALTVLRHLMDFLYDHTEIESLTILCGDPATYRAYSLHFNMWYAAHKPPHEH